MGERENPRVKESERVTARDSERQQETAREKRKRESVRDNERKRTFVCVVAEKETVSRAERVWSLVMNTVRVCVCDGIASVCG